MASPFFAMIAWRLYSALTHAVIASRTGWARGAAAPRAAVRHEAVGRAGEERQPVLCHDVKHHQQQQRSEGVGAAALAFGGLSYEECVTAFLAPHARCCLPPAPPNLSSLATLPPASQAPPAVSQGATFSAVADCTYEFPFAQDAFPVAASSNTAALCRAVKRPREDCPEVGAQKPLLGRDSQLLQGGVVQGGTVRGGMVQGGMVCGTESRHQSVAEQFQHQGASRREQPSKQFQQQGASRHVQIEEAALLDALLEEEHRKLEWESALPNDVLLGVSSLDAVGFSSLDAVGFTTPCAPEPAPLPTPLAAALATSVPVRMGSSTGGTLVVSSCTQPELDTCSVAHDDVALSSDMPVDPLLLSGHAPTVPLLPHGQLVRVPWASRSQGRLLAGTGGGGAGLEEWALEQGGSTEGGACTRTLPFSPAMPSCPWPPVLYQLSRSWRYLGLAWPMLWKVVELHYMPQ
ncbi:unnamed protein product [Closterium sp. NIES-65]|nr:unnamed protein product [Closterium sp. NIES-65]